MRIIHREPPRGRWRRLVSLLLVLAVGAGGGYLFHRKQAQTSPADHAAQEQRPDSSATAAIVALRPHVAVPVRAAGLPLPTVHEEEPTNDNDLPSQDLNDVSNYISPGGPVPTMTEVITALHDAGIHDGLGAFNPPGTSPPLQGLVVPEDFELPEGYVRHHQVTDEGEPIPPILMFSPDFKLYDKSGNLIEIPPDRVVPPELAPLGMPIVQVQIPSP